MGAKQNLRYHIVLVSKYRSKVFEGIEDQVLTSIESTARASAFKVEQIAVEDGNHVHLVVRTTGTYSVSSLVRRLKAMSSAALWAAEEDHLRRFYWSKKRKLWSGGYYAATLGDVSVAQVKKYLKKQGHWK